MCGTRGSYSKCLEMVETSGEALVGHAAMGVGLGSAWGARLWNLRN